MPTIVTINDDVFVEVEKLASAEKQSVGDVLSGLARKALRFGEEDLLVTDDDGFLVLAAGNRPPVTLHLVNQLRDEAP